MLFNSYEFIFLFLPITFFIYFYLNSKRLTEAGKAFLVFASLLFYSWWNIIYLPLILTSMLFNYTIGNMLSSNKYERHIKRKSALVIGIVSNLALLGYFKYADFFIANINLIFHGHIEMLKIALPLAISFFTFQQIAYLVDSYRQETKEYDFLNYALFVTFFPQLIAGPIVHHKEVMPQFASKWHKVKNYRNIALGLFIFSMGLFKKVVIADTFATYATTGFDQATTLAFFQAWATSLSYTFQLYFDFSGYTDMAIGAALLFNIRLPMNFNSPYKALDIQDFWRRWHMTLSRFLRDYIYIPLGGSRVGRVRIYANLMITFILGGLWHGAGWTFVFWGFLHGIALVIHRAWSQIGFKLPKVIAWFITFNFVNIAWVFFRAKEWNDALKVLSGMFGMKAENFKVSMAFSNDVSMWLDIPLHEYIPSVISSVYVNEIALVYTLLMMPCVLLMKNSMYYMNKRITLQMIIVASCAFVLSMISSLFTSTEVFLYFNF
ncbi:MAG: MBOAT family protein [Campylobacterales bacterium]|nr:MBOAT family protein [Campylobacterales bacterium]MBN2832925.1 MBOAT family protein [Campylobacterales bacterium]